jgi:heme-degrading monooxygenase HmoA
MFAVVNHLHLDVPVEQLKAEMDAEGIPLLASQPGFKNVYYVKEDDTHAVVIILWESGEAAANGSKVFGPSWFASHIAPHLASEQRRSMGPVVAMG